ncbi:nck-associated protein 5-like [Denticeps clupeoides]|uniref:nck-associated protein 5-like n=1 Tax=Denticeps clupeoides TaxID=299321 RepID=UPI0010A38E67|nr:nck-associated protein 5-like [Denticeps clupeoides]XP_028848386.1 nck-associated protein 5-like [Denticeps clupeoides]XP_028848388.1 nck-associated protein 5-like [Denticeps clupeoides]XP_028848389.1 nck-associated protein 5-like [Denticeps clupeoides]XP_028848390.1 nck-associated protein 5-like [Denticeps clupeoides]XP_028849058.1 nck-associated protein 5-like [Denticeps clupeoides]XP_028849059.1 nck-associated protein 5-like [Denticeps clupeoides]XP_028849060.1 nck-associated protein 5
MMCEDVQERPLEEDLDSEEEGDLESYLEEESSNELLERVRELQAENSALALANESQREAYERCLDEVANHVVQALLNQKDLREECIKLKMRVFDLERQNRTLCDLLQEKMLSQSSIHHQPSLGAMTELKQELEAQNNSQLRGHREHVHNGTTESTDSSMEALSPFLKKKAHILEVLRKMEETDPLKFHLSCSFCNYSQSLVSKDTVLKSRFPQALCSQMCTNPNAHQHANGEGGGSASDHSSCQKCMKCLMLSNRDGNSPAKNNHTCTSKVDNLNLACPDNRETKFVLAADGTNSLSNRLSVDTSIHSQKREDTSSKHQSSDVSDSYELTDQSVISDSYSLQLSKSSSDVPCKTEGALMEKDIEPRADLHAKEGSVKISTAEVNNTSKLPALEVKSAYCESDKKESVHKGLLFSPSENNFASKVLDDISVPEKDNPSQDLVTEKAKIALNPTHISCLTEVKASSSKLLRFLKIPNIGERTSVANPLRLSPQLTRSSKIPCRTNNYEVHHSPVTPRKANTTERQRQTLSSKQETYLNTLSAPTPPPQTDDLSLSSEKELGVSLVPSTISPNKPTMASQLQKNLQKVPHYENVHEPSHPRGLSASQIPEEATVSFFHTGVGIQGKQANVSAEKPPGLKQQNSLGGSDSLCDCPVSDSISVKADSTVWHPQPSHHSLPSHSSLSKIQHAGSSVRPQDKADQEQIIIPQVSEHFQSSPPAAPRTNPPPIPKKSGIARHSGESSHSFKERLAALGKLRNIENSPVSVQTIDVTEAQSTVSKMISTNAKIKTAERLSDFGEHSHAKSTTNNTGSVINYQGPCQSFNQGAKSLPSSSLMSKSEVEFSSPKIVLAKPESPKTKALPLSMPNSEASQAVRTYAKSTPPQNLPNIVKTFSSPNKLPIKSPTKSTQVATNLTKPVQEVPRYLSKSEDRSQVKAKKKSTTSGDSLPPHPTRSSDTNEEKRHSAPSPQSAIEQKVMKGIEENVLKLQEQDKGQPPEVKQKTSNGIASWFGLKKSKLPALSRKHDLSKGKEDKKEWKLSISSMGKDTKLATKAKSELESLNISILMEKAQDLHKALEGERAYVNGMAADRSGRGHSCEVVMDQAQGQLSVMYRGITSDNFMQQLLNRVDGQDPNSGSMSQRRLSFDCKSKSAFNLQPNGISQTRSSENMEKCSDLISKVDHVTSVESVAEPIHHQHFAGSGMSTYTLDSGIGTFPLPDSSVSAGNKSIPKLKSRGEGDISLSSGTKVPRKAWTLERELSSLEEGGKELEALEAVHMARIVQEDDDHFRANLIAKNWTFPSLKMSAEAPDVYVSVRDGVEPEKQKNSFRRNTKHCEASAPHDTRGQPVPAPAQPGPRAKGHSHGNLDAGLELVREGPDDALSPGPQLALETPESLSDSLYDSLSSCGSQG